MRRAVVFASILAVAIVATQGCRAPTQITVTIRTTVPCAQLRGVQITVGPDPVGTEAKVASNFITTSTNHCGKDGLIGSLVITPGGQTAAIVVAARLGEGACAPPSYQGCVVARRSFPFVEHVPLDIPIGLDLDCANIPCDALNTCAKGRCLGAALTCDENGTCTAPGGTTFSGSDGGPSLPSDAGGGDDATLASDGAIDAQTSSDGAGDAPADVVSDGGPNTCTGSSTATKCSCLANQYCCLRPGTDNTMKCQDLGTTCDALALCCTANSGCPGGGSCCIREPLSGATSTGCTGPGQACPAGTRQLCEGNNCGTACPNGSDMGAWAGIAWCNP